MGQLRGSHALAGIPWGTPRAGTARPCGRSNVKLVLSLTSCVVPTPKHCYGRGPAPEAQGLFSLFIRVQGTYPPIHSTEVCDRASQEICPYSLAGDSLLATLGTTSEAGGEG